MSSPFRENTKSTKCSIILPSIFLIRSVEKFQMGSRK